MTGQTAAERATALLDLHSPGDPVVLPTVWDAWSARLATDARRAHRGQPSLFFWG